MNKTNKNIDELFHNGSEIDEALQQAVKEALLQHKKAGNIIVSWENDKIVWIQPEDIVIDVKKEKQDVKP